MTRKGSTQLPESTLHTGITPPEDPDLLDLLSFEHRQIRRLWSELQLAHRRHVEEAHRPAARLGLTGQRELGRQIVEALTRHEAVELERLYPMAAEVVGDAWAEHARGDHADLRDFLDEVDGENPEDSGVFEIYTEVMAKLLAHITEEESIIFPMLRAVLPSQDLAGDAGLAGAPRPGPEVVDLAGAEDELAGAAAGGNGRGQKTRFKLRRR